MGIYTRVSRSSDALWERLEPPLGSPHMSVCTPEGAVVVDTDVVDYEKCPCWDEELVYFTAVAASYGGGEREDLVNLRPEIRVR